MASEHHCVYILKCSNGKHYTGCTSDLKDRMARHQAGAVPATSKLLPVELMWCCRFNDKYKAFTFERYLKSGSGRAFSLHHLL
ncbi:MAG: GIY-YIG nuclease family protein [Flavobacteriales bacterium]|nr:MAG: GIY-YIG nuclease family protein [Flavobacteriales bacterium]